MDPVYEPGEVFGLTMRFLVEEDARRALDEGGDLEHNFDAAGEDLEEQLLVLAGNGVIRSR